LDAVLGAGVGAGVGARVGAGAGVAAAFLVFLTTFGALLVFLDLRGTEVFLALATIIPYDYGYFLSFFYHNIFYHNFKR